MTSIAGFGWLGLLLAGLGFGLVAKVVLRKRVQVGWAATILVGIIGAGLGTTVASLLSLGSAVDFSDSVIAGIAGSIIVLALYAAIASRFGARVRADTFTLLQAGESAQVEFKATARHNRYTNKRDPRIEHAIVKSIAGFLNARGGTLLIGVADDASIVGIQDDLEYLKSPDLDRFELWLTDLLDHTIGKSAASSITTTFTRITGETIARLDVLAHPEPVFVNPAGGERRADFYVRIGNSTRRLLTDEAIAYARTHWSRVRRDRLPSS